MTRLSVIIPGYNTPKELWRRCVKSVCAACCEDDEIICVDDGSKIKPEFLNDIAKDDSRVKTIFLSKNVGQAAARNVALNVARGDWVAFVDSDDSVLEQTYSNAIDKSKMYNADIVVFGVRAVWLNDGLYKQSVPYRNENIGVLSTSGLKYLIDMCLFDVVCSKVYKRNFLMQNNIRFPVNICPGEDTMFALQCVMKGATWATLNEIGYIYYRMDNTSLSTYKSNLVATLEYWKVRWDEYLTTIGQGYDGWWPTKDYSPEWVARQQWDNIWMRGSKWSMVEKWNYLCLHKAICKHPVAIEYLRKAIYSFLRRYFYLKPIRRFHLRHLWADSIKDLPNEGSACEKTI